MNRFLIVLAILQLHQPNALSQDKGHADHNAKVVQKKDELRVPIEVPQAQQERIGLKTTPALKQPVQHTIRTVGTVTADQRSEAHIHTRINGWIERIFADYIGKPVKKGQSLFDLYSPDLVSTQEEYLAARKQGSAGKEIAQAALERLKLWGVPEAEIQRLRTSGKSKRAISFSSPVDGLIVNKTAIQGMYVTPEMDLYYLANLESIWVVITLYEYDIAVVQLGDLAEIQLPYQPNQTFKAKISYIYPQIEMETRTAKARIELSNPDLVLKPGMFTNVEIKKDLGEAIVIPDDSVIDTGTRKIVFVKSSGVRFEPREVKTGPRVGDQYTVLSGVSPGEEVVISAHFLIDAESKFQAALTKGGPPVPTHGGHGADHSTKKSDNQKRKE